MTFNRLEAKARARMSMKNANPNVMLVGLVYVLATVGVANVVDLIVNRGGTDYFTTFYTYIQAGYDPTDVVRYMATSFVSTGILAAITSVIVSLYTIVVSLGMVSYCMRVARHEEAGYRNLLDGMSGALRVIGCYILQNIYVFLWTFVAIIPGMVVMVVSIFSSGLLLVLGLILYMAGVIFGISVSYRYRLSFYYLIDYPDMGAGEAITESKNAMAGKKGSLFVLDFSFLGWAILTIITFGIVGLWVEPYRGTVVANFYDCAQHGRYSAPDGASGQAPEFMQ